MSYILTTKGFKLDTSESRFKQFPDGHWENLNHRGENLGYTVGPTQPDRHGFAGAVSSVANTAANAVKTVGHGAGSVASALGSAASTVGHTVGTVVSVPVHVASGAAKIVVNEVKAVGADIIHNPLGAVATAVVAISAAPILPIAAAVAGSSAAVAEGATRLTDGLGFTHGANDVLHSGERYVATHPVEVGEAIAAIETVAAGAAVGGPLAAGAATAVAGALGKGALAHSLPTGGGPATSGNPTLDNQKAGEANIWKAFLTKRKGV